jgi:uncharacterized membrane protein
MWLGALRGVAIAGNFDQQRAHGRAELGLEQQIQNLAALRFGIIFQQNRSGSAAAAVKAFTAGVAFEIHDLIRKRRRKQARRKAAKQTDHQAHLWAFVDNSRLFGLLALGCVPLIFLFKRIKREPVRAVEAP